MKRLGVRLVIGALAGCILISCATKKEKPSARTAATVKAKAKPKASPPPSPAPTPTPAPTPEVHYVATVKVEGGESTQADITPYASPSPAPTASPSPTASPTPSPTPKAASGNVFTNTWRKIFPAKAKPAPPRAAAPAPARTQPAESIPGRMWHMIFPRKKAPPAAAPPQWIGTIKLVNEREGYVLIDASNGVAISTDQTLNSVGNETESGVVRVSADRNPPFFIADIVSGKPRPGDRIYSPQP